MHSHHFIHFHNFIYQRVIYRKISLELCKIWMRQGLRECALTYNVTTLKPPPSWLGDPSIRPCQGSVSGTGSPNFLACHQSLSKGSTPPPAPSQARKRQSWENILPGAVASARVPISHQNTSHTWETSAGHGDWFSVSSHTPRMPGVQVQGGVGPASTSCFPSSSRETAMSSHEKPLGRNPFSPYNEQMPHRFGASFVNDFKVYLSTPRRLLESPTSF